jgi:N-acetylglucosamine-6-phosphate deacetylase
MTVLRGGRVVTPVGVLEDGWVSVEGGRITGTGRGPAQSGPSEGVDLGGRWLLPGFIDVHVHGGGGHDVTASPEDMAGAVAFHRQHGTTRTLVSLVTAPPDAVVEQLGWVADAVAAGPGPSGHVVGAHLEGPFLSRSRRGAQNPDHILMPDRAVFARFVEAGRGTVRSMTIAPELPGALEVIADILDAGAVAAVGHSDATYAEARAGIDAGAAHATHLFNGMRPLHHREPGIIGAALVSGITCEVINDGVHVHPAITSLVASVPGRMVFVTDAVRAAGMGDGDFFVGGLHVHVSGGQARLAGTDTLAGSSLTLDAALRRAVQECGVPIEVASAAASGNPARLIGIDNECGAIVAGRAADLVVLDQDLRVVAVMAGGQWDAPDPASGPGPDPGPAWSWARP